MNAQKIILHGVAVVALGAMCVAQSSMGQQGQNQQGTGQRGMGQQNGSNANMPDSMSADNSTPDMGIASPDQLFMKKAAQGGLAEVRLGNIAKQNGSSDAVKQFGDRMITDHTQAGDELKQIAQKKGVTLPSDVTTKDKKMSKMLEAKQGSDFDKAYIHDMVKDHEEDVAEFRNEAANGKDPEVKAWAQKTLPTLESHLAQAKQVAGQVGAGKSAAAMSAQQ
jgi:putative membrane protein